MGLSRGYEPIDELLARLRSAQGPAWLEGELRGGRLAPPELFEKLRVGSEVPIEGLERLKERGNELLKAPSDRDALLAGMAGYFLAVAAALATRGTLITSQNPERLAPILRRLSEAAPEPWKGIFAAAANRR